MKHTPGPWYFRRKALRGWVVRDCKTETDIDVSSNEANACLVAAAPELLDALENLYALVSGPESGIPDEKYHIVLQANSVLRSARGES